MYLKSVEMRGFKSFVDETKMDFESGITAVVGPNGCGKSNIADALRWVLGEQSAKILRGMKMEDFIFNGSGGRKPAGFAEVAITISNADGGITVHPYSEYEEVTVTRKLYRTGESEYYINKVPCRLKDIVDVFLDTGVSSRSFSIIEQAQVTRIVNSKPDDRRYIIEEAAGVMKYKHRRNAAINKLEASQQNLLRIQDILGELERQRNSLNRQAKKAERYKAFRAEIKSRGLAYYAVEYQRKVEELDAVSAELERAKEAEAALVAELSARRNDVESLSSEIAKEERTLGDMREERSQLISKMERNDHHRELLVKQLNEMAASNTRAVQEIETDEGEITKLDALITERSEDIKRLEGEITHNQERAGGLKKRADEIRAELAGLGGARDEKSRESLKVMESISSKNNAKSSITAKIEMSGERISGVEEKEKEITERVSRLDESAASLRSGLEEREREAGQERQRNKEIRASLEMGSDALKVAEEELRAAESEMTRQASRLESLQELDRNMEGFGAGVRGLMKLKQEGEEALEGVRGLMADGVRAPQEMETALASILGNRLEAVIMEDSAQSLEAVRVLKRDSIGRASFIPADLAPNKKETAPPPTHSSLVGRALDIFSLSGSLPQSVSALLEDTLIAYDIDGAMEIWRSNPGAFTVVTVEGDVIDSSGMVTAGAPEKGQSAGIVARKRMIEELAASIGILNSKTEEAEAKRNALRDSVNTERARLEESEKALKALELQVLDLSKELQREESENQRNRAQLENLAQERARAVEDRERLMAEDASISTQLEELAGRKGKIDAQVERFSAEMENLRQKLEGALGEVSKEEVSLTELRGRMDNLRLDTQRLESAKADLITRVQRLKDSIRDFDDRKKEMRESIESLLAENVELARKKDSVSHGINELSDTFDVKVDEKIRMERQAKELEGKVDHARESASGMALNKSELEMRLENIVEKADHEFNIPIEDLREADISEVDMEETSQRLASLRGELSRIGDVNMSALEEFAEIDERYEFMKTQHADLIASITTLRKTIDSINATTNTMFNKTFKEVSENFQNVFKRLFGGGRAEMTLIEEEGKTEPGLEILVQPPGKKVQNLNLLSAGEKAMTAIALLFAVFMTKPSPFCLLDEVDAPLDEANIFRFRDMLMEMKANTQFIIITHSQKTMSFAERLYGVTQEEEGVSKILAVNLMDRRHEDMALSAA